MYTMLAYWISSFTIYKSCSILFRLYTKQISFTEMCALPTYSCSQMIKFFWMIGVLRPREVPCSSLPVVHHRSVTAILLMSRMLHRNQNMICIRWLWLQPICSFLECLATTTVVSCALPSLQPKTLTMRVFCALSKKTFFDNDDTDNGLNRGRTSKLGDS